MFTALMSCRVRRCLGCLGAIGLVILTVGARTAESDQPMKVDCGVNALYLLLQLEGNAVTLQKIDALLPPRRPDGYSMAELSGAARSLGLNLDGIRFGKGDRALTRPAIAFLKRGKNGHFAVLRPVGTTGTMVQIIDPPSPPWIADYDRIFAAKPWTGRILVARNSWLLGNAVPLMTALFGFTLLVVALRRRVRGARPVRGGATAV
jgi:Peptidase C39 family